MSWHHVGARPSATTMLIRLWLHCHIIKYCSRDFAESWFLWFAFSAMEHVWSSTTRVANQSWWRYRVLPAPCAGNSPVTGEFPSQRPVTRSVDVFFGLRPNRWVNNQNAGDSKRHRAHCDVTVMIKKALCHQLRFTLTEITRVIPVSNNNPMSRYHGHTSGDSGPTNNG